MEQSRWEPAAKRTTLILLAGTIWAIVGIYLLGKGIHYLRPFESITWWFGLGGLIAGILKSKIVFSRIINKNVLRIKELAPHKDKVCIFAFQAWASYLIVLVMISFGVILRSMSLPSYWLGGIFVLIGTALFSASLKYFQYFKAR